MVQPAPSQLRSWSRSYLCALRAERTCRTWRRLGGRDQIHTRWLPDGAYNEATSLLLWVASSAQRRGSCATVRGVLGLLASRPGLKRPGPRYDTRVQRAAQLAAAAVAEVPPSPSPGRSSSKGDRANLTLDWELPPKPPSEPSFKPLNRYWVPVFELGVDGPRATSGLGCD